MKYKIVLTAGAKQDLRDIVQYIRGRDGVDRARHVNKKIREKVFSLEDMPNRGVYLKEAQEIGRREFREIFFKPYRIIYQVINRKVVVLLIADGRRNMRELLERRLFS